MRKDFRSNVIVLISSILLTFAIAELVTRCTWEAPAMQFLPGRALMWSCFPFETDRSNVVRFIRNALIREIVIFHNAVEYDMWFKTNNMGFVDDLDYGVGEQLDQDARKIAIVGDSLGVGEGGFSWIPLLRKKLLSARNRSKIYNLSVTGAGIKSFYEILVEVSHEFPGNADSAVQHKMGEIPPGIERSDYHKDSIEARSEYFTDIVILAIGDDMKRIPFAPVAKDGYVYFCPSGTAPNSCFNSLKPFATLIAADASEKELLSRAKILKAAQASIENAQNAKQGTGLGNQVRIFFRNSLFLRMLNNARRTLMSFRKPDFTPLFRIRSSFPRARIYFVHLPMKNEVSSGKYSLELRQEVESLGIRYIPTLTRCQWSKNMFHKNDGHPNPAGYAHITQCLEKCLFQ